MRRSVLVGSIAVHAALAALLYGLPRREAAPRARRLIEIVPPASAPERAVLAAPPQPHVTPGGAAAESAPAAAPRPAPAAVPRPAPAAAPRLAPAVAPRLAPAAAPAPAAPPAPAPAAAAPSRLAITGYDRGAAAGDRATAAGDLPGGTSLGLGDGAGVGLGDGVGLGLGTGLGLGDGIGAGPGLRDLASLPAPPPAPLPPPPPPPPPAEKPPSRARPPRLIYPARDRPSDDAETFVARLTVDTDGYVVGARLIRGLGGPRDELASQLVWRFRYAPALDVDGREIRATIDQRFLVGY